MTFQLRDYQDTISTNAAACMKKRGLCYLAMEVRTGKTITSFAAMDKVGATNVLFVTKKKPIDNGNLQADYDLMSPSFKLTLSTNHHLTLAKHLGKGYDAIIIDEAHCFGAFPKPSKRCKAIAALIDDCNPQWIILMSGTPTPESYSEIYHQTWMLHRQDLRGDPKTNKNFYRWADKYVNVYQMKIRGHQVNSYERGREKEILKVTDPWMIRWTQKDSGFVNTINEEFVSVTPSLLLSKLFSLALDKETQIIQGRSGDIVMDSAATKLNKCHQLCGGTIILDHGESIIVDEAKGRTIKNLAAKKKLLIFYKFKAELRVIQTQLGESVTTDFNEFRTTDKSIAVQIVSGREGVSYKEADAIVFYNVDFSATSYRQARDRLTTKTRESTTVYWLMYEGGIEHEVYKRVIKKKKFTTSHFKSVYKL